MLCKLSLKRLLYVFCVFAALISLHVLITIINNEAEDNTLRQHTTLAELAEKTTTAKTTKKHEKKLETEVNYYFALE